MKTPRFLNAAPLAPKFWYGLSAASLFLWAGLSVATLMLCSCISNGEGPEAPFPGSPEALLQSHAAKWNNHAKRSYAIDFGTDSLNGTRTITCQAEKGAFKGQCLSVDRCCGEDPESTYVDPPYPVPGELLSSLAKRIAALKYEGAETDENSLTVFKFDSTGSASTKIGFFAKFDLEYGFPLWIASLGPADPYFVQIKRLEFR